MIRSLSLIAPLLAIGVASTATEAAASFSGTHVSCFVETDAGLDKIFDYRGAEATARNGALDVESSDRRLFRFEVTIDEQTSDAVQVHGFQHGDADNWIYCVTQ